MEKIPQILIVDDDFDIRTLLADYLAGQGLSVTVAADGTEMMHQFAECNPDLIVLDLNLPGKDGLTLCREFRARSQVPVIMLTARDEPLDRIIGLEMGADDYLGKPFEPRELLSRIKTVLRRTKTPEPTSVNIKRILFADWTLDLTARHLLNSQGMVVALSGAEFRLLKIFLDHPNRILDRDMILNLTQGRDAGPFDRSIDLQVSRLRQKLQEDARMPSIIKTVRNEGYVFTVAVREVN